MNVINEAPLYLGIDGGGTKCKVLLKDATGNKLATGIGGPANVVRSLDDTINSMLFATTSALEQAGLSTLDFPRIIAAAGIAGANVPAKKSALLNWRHPFAKLHITTDMDIACLGAHHHHSGSVIIVGTGFCAGIKTNDNIKEIGGYGLFLGDKASGSSLGLTAIQRCLQVLDGVIPASDFSQAILEQLTCQNAEQLLSLTLEAQPSFYAQLAPRVFEFAQQKDVIALPIIETAAQYIHLYAKHILSMAPQRLCLLGGIAPNITPWLDYALSAQLCQPLNSPEAGALLLARQLT